MYSYKCDICGAYLDPGEQCDCRNTHDKNMRMVDELLAPDQDGQMTLKESMKMEHIPGYDEWKTTPPDDPDPAAYCNFCGCEMYEGDMIYTIDGGICEKCMNDIYRRML